MPTRLALVALFALCPAHTACRGAEANPPAPVVDVLRARQIELVDANGRPRAQLAVEDSGEVILRLRDQEGTIRVKLGAGADGSGLLLNNDATEPGFHALAGAAGTTITLRNRDGKEVVLKP